MKNFLTSTAIAAVASFAVVEMADARGRSAVIGKAKSHFSAKVPRPPKKAQSGSGGGIRPPKPPKASSATPPKPPRKLTPIFNNAARPPSPPNRGKPPALVHKPKGPVFKPPGI